jgi:hypothetical protein
VCSSDLYASLALDRQDKAHLAYYDATNFVLKYATNASGAWVKSAVDSAGIVGQYASLALDRDDKAHLAYYDATGFNLKYITNKTGAWLAETVDSAGLVGAYPSIKLDSRGQPHIAYQDATNATLKYAWYYSPGSDNPPGPQPGPPPGGDIDHFGGGRGVALGLDQAGNSRLFNQALAAGSDLDWNRVFPFSLGTDPAAAGPTLESSQMPGLVMTWVQPEGASQAWWLAVGRQGVLPNGTTWDLGLWEHLGVSILDLRRSVPSATLKALAKGTHVVGYWLQDPVGNKSNPREESFVIE